LALAKSLGAKVSVIFVVEPFAEMTGRFLEAVARYVELRKEQATSVLDRVANAAKEAGVSCETIQAENAQPHQGIIAARSQARSMCPSILWQFTHSLRL
jgi:hypothetical protein